MEWSSASLQELMRDLRNRQGDLTDVEVKSAAGGLPSLGSTICAFANMPEGGTIILGLDESAGFVPVGLSNIAALEQGVAAQARTSVTPPVQCEFQTFQAEGRPILVAVIEGLPLHDRPARHGGLAYLRQSDGDYVMSEQEIAQLELAKTQAVRPTQPDRQPAPGTSSAELDAALLTSFLVAARSSSRRYAAASDNDVLRFTGVLTTSGELSLAGVYALGVSPQALSPSLSVTAAVQLPRGAVGRTRDLAHLTGPIPDLLDDTMAWVVRNTRTTMGYDQRGHGVDATEIPMRAVREIVANALVHRNLDSITGSKRVEVRLLHDRLVITSPGGLWGVSESQLGRPGAKSAVNPTLYDICKYLRMPDGSRVIEGEGGGIREAIDALREAGLRPPRFVDTGIQFTAIILRHTLLAEEDLAWLSEVADDLDLSSEQRAILASMRNGDTWTNARVRREFAPMDSVAARRLLQQLVETGLVTTRGERGATTYGIDPSHLRRQRPQFVVQELQGEPHATKTTVKDSAEMHAAASVREPRAAVRSTRHGRSVLDALAEPRSLAEIVAITDLSEGQVRYALGNLMKEGSVVMLGGQGMRSTRYERPGGR
ncbi:MAG: ATP-binding protein [Propionicimonas sp.]